MAGILEAHGRWFCSPVCVAKYENRGQSPEKRGESPHFSQWLRQPAIWGIALLAIAASLGHFWPAAGSVSAALQFYLAKAGWAIALGLVLGGIIDHFVPKTYISLALASRRKRTILTAASLGFLASSCSHGCLALSMELYRKGASPASVITFLLASPWASLPLTLLILSLMGWKGLWIVLTALLIALLSGLVFQRLERQGRLGVNPNTVAVADDFSIWRDLKKRWKDRRWNAKTLRGDVAGVARGSWGLAQMVLFWVALGFTLSAVLGAAVPEGWWGRFLGPHVAGLLATLGIATVMEVCSEGTAPLAVELFRQTGALGNAFAFLMGGVVTDFTELSLLWANLGRKVVGWFLVVTLPQVLLWGIIMNLF